VVTGAIERGSVEVGNTVEVVGLGEGFTAVVTGVETFGKTMERGEAGDNASRPSPAGKALTMTGGGSLNEGSPLPRASP
jgi:translation elongation factor EF-Tu-like GTPase